MREGRHWGNSQETGVEAGLALENRRELVAGDAGVLALRRHSPQTFRPIRTTTRSRRCGSGAAYLWDVRVAGVYGKGVGLSEPPRCPGTWPPPQTSGADVKRTLKIVTMCCCWLVAGPTAGRRADADLRRWPI